MHKEKASISPLTAGLKTRIAVSREKTNFGHVIAPVSPRNLRFLGVEVRSLIGFLLLLALHRFYPGFTASLFQRADRWLAARFDADCRLSGQQGGHEKAPGGTAFAPRPGHIPAFPGPDLSG